jgi:orotidine 5'-phosphate decarboxylase subfamily 1
MDLIIQLQRMSEQHDFMIFEDRKFADIGNTVKLQYQDGVYHIADWADITNAHPVPGPGVVEGLKEIGLHKGRGLLLLAQMTSEGTLAKDTYTEESIEMAKAHKDFVIGFISTKKLSDDPAFIYMSPGVKLLPGGDALGQQYLTPEKVILKNESDVIIVGRGIYQSLDPLVEAKKYREAGWRAYEKRIMS